MCIFSSYRYRKRHNRIWEGFPAGEGANTSNRKAQSMRVCTKCFSQARRNPARFLVGFLYDEVLRNLCFRGNTQGKKENEKRRLSVVAEPPIKKSEGILKEILCDFACVFL